MDLLFHLIRRVLPVGLIAGAGFVMFSSFAPVATDRVESFGIDAVSSDADLSALSTLPADPPLSAKVELNWNEIELNQGEYSWTSGSNPDLLITGLSSQNREIIAVLKGGPVYLVSDPGNAIDQTRLLLRWAAFVQAAVDRYGEQVHDWEIGSAINTVQGISSFLYPQNSQAAIRPDPLLYAKLVKTASAVIKNKDPNDEVWTGSLVGVTSSRCAMNPLTFLLELHGAKAWSALDGIDFDPDRGSALPEDNAAVAPECASSLPLDDTSLSGETRALQELVRQLDGKLIRVSGLGWSTDELSGLVASRVLSQESLHADLLTRASIPLLAQNSVPSVLWSFQPAIEPAALAALTNLETLLVGAKPVGQVQGDNGSVKEYRFQKGDQIIIVVWRTIDGDTPAPVNLSNLQVRSLTAFPVDAASFDSQNGTTIPVNENGESLILVNERPVVLVGNTAVLSVAIQQEVQNGTELAQLEVKQALRRLANNQKAALKQWIASLFDSARDQAVNWGEDTLNQLLN